MALSIWKKGDRVVHAGKPEWGSGDVTLAEPTMHNGTVCQKLTIRFSRAGVKTIMTALADIQSAEHSPRMSEDRPTEPLAVIAGAADAEELLLKIPEKAADPFSSLADRLRATLDLYKFADSPSGLLDWAAIQTGLRDPLSRFSRHELEQYHGRFRVELDGHLKKLLRDARKANPAMIAEVSAAAGPAGKQALRRVDGGR